MSAEVMIKNVDLWMWFALIIIINKMQNDERVQRLVVYKNVDLWMWLA